MANKKTAKRKAAKRAPARKAPAKKKAAAKRMIRKAAPLRLSAPRPFPTPTGGSEDEN